MTSEHVVRQRRARCLSPFRAHHSDHRAIRGFRVCGSGSTGILATRFCLVLFAVIAISGCGKLTEDLNSAKKQIELLNVETKGLAERLSSLDADKARLNEEMKLLTERNDVLRNQVTALERAKSALEKELDAAKKKSGETLTEVESLKRQKSDLEREVETLKKPTATAPPLPEEPRERMTETTAPPDVTKGAPASQAEMSPCDTVLEYMRKSQAIVRQYKGEERSKKLEQLTQQLGPQMSGAPEKALKAAEKWVNEVVRIWDNPREDSAFILLSNKDTVFRECHKTPEEAGF